MLDGVEIAWLGANEEGTLVTVYWTVRWIHLSPTMASARSCCYTTRSYSELREER